MEKLIQYKSEIDQWKQDAPLYQAYEEPAWWIELAVTKVKRDQWVKDYHNDPNNAISKKILAALDELTKSIEKKGGAGKIVNPLDGKLYVELSSAPKDYLKAIAKTKTRIANGEVNKEELEEEYYITQAFSTDKEERKRIYAQNYCNNATEKKAVDVALIDLRDFAIKHGLGMKQQINPVYQVWEEEINEDLSEAKAYNGKTKTSFPNSIWVFRAISKKERAEWKMLFEGKDAETQAQLSALLDELGDICKNKIPQRKPDASLFAIRNAGDEKTIQNVSVKGSNKWTTHSIGIADKDWFIQKASSFDNTPRYRYKRAYIYVKDAASDYPYCNLLTYELRQDYAGNGIYNNTYGFYVGRSIYGCP
jgi:hypothetical protein